MWNRVLLLSLLLVGSVLLGFSQDLDSYPKAKRDSILIEIAKTTVLKYGKGYYNEYKEPIIERVIVPQQGYPDGKNVGRFFYRVTFLYDKNKEELELDYAARVVIWADTGRANAILFGNGFGRSDLEEIERKRQVVKEVPYEPLPPVEIIDWSQFDPK